MAAPETPETAWFRGEGGGVWRFDLPLSEVMAEQAAKGLLVRVHEDGSTWAEPPPAEPVEADSGPAESAPAKPAQADSKAAWVAYAHAVTGRPVDELDALTKADLIKEVG
jgi:hypothetical protein